MFWTSLLYSGIYTFSYSSSATSDTELSCHETGHLPQTETDAVCWLQSWQSYGMFLFIDCGTTNVTFKCIYWNCENYFNTGLFKWILKCYSNPTFWITLSFFSWLFHSLTDADEFLPCRALSAVLIFFVVRGWAGLWLSCMGGIQVLGCQNPTSWHRSEQCM